MGNLPFLIAYTDGDKHITVKLDKEKLTVDEASSLAHHLSYFVQEMEIAGRRISESALV